MFIVFSPELKLYLKKLVYFMAPFFALLLLLEYFSYAAGELWPIEKVIFYQNNSTEKVLFNRKVIDDEIAKYKYLNILAKTPKVLVYGSSRAMQIREEMFKENQSFYNASGMAHNVGDLLDFISLLPEDKSPEIIILNLDFYWFGKEREITQGLTKALSAANPIYRWESHLYADKYLLTNGFKDWNLWTRIEKGRDKFEGSIALGYQALDGNGFRPDGSYQYGAYLAELRNNSAYRDRSGFLDRLENGISQFKFNSDFDEQRVGILEKFLAECQRRGIKVIAFAPPMSSEIFTALKSSPYHQKLINDFQLIMPGIIKKYDYPYFDFSDLQSLGLDNLYMFDGLHATETAMAKILVAASSDSELQKIINPDLEKILTDTQTTPFELKWRP